MCPFCGLLRIQFLTSLLLVLAASGSALAQTTIGVLPADRSFDIQLFHPPVGPKGFITIDSAEVPEHKLLNVGLLTNYQYGPFSLDSSIDDATTRLNVVRHQAMAELYGAVGLYNLFELGVAVPMTLVLRGDDFTATGQPTGTSISAAGVGDIRIEGKAELLSFGHNQSFLLALSAGGTVPTGDQNNFLGEKSATGRVRALLEYQHSEKLRGILMAGALFRKKSEAFRAEAGSQALYGAAVDYRALADMSVLAEVTGRVGSLSWIDSNPMEADMAIRAYLPSMFSLTMGAGMGLNRGLGSPLVRAFVGVGWAPDYRDRDRDGVYDLYDRCPDEPEDRDGYQDDDGCPDEDNDGDGIPDTADKCPNDPEDVDSFQDEDGCPDVDNDADGIPDLMDACPNAKEDGQGKRPKDGCPSTSEDSDGDGIPDVSDKCPDEPEDMDGFEDTDGCPDIDNDGDGIPDGYDACPNEAEDMDNFEDNDGCPELDNDHDGIPDAQDKCPNQPETLNGYRDDDGCPDAGAELVVLGTDKIEIRERVTFQSGGTQLSPSGATVVKLVAMVLRGHPELAKIRVEVRAEGVSDDTIRGRGETVVKALVAHGVDSKRLKAVPMGPGGGRVDFIIESRTAAKKAKGNTPAGDTNAPADGAAPSPSPSPSP